MTEKKNNEGYSVEINIPEGITAEMTGDKLKFKGSFGEIIRVFSNPIAKVILNGNIININSTINRISKKSKRMVETYNAHIKNMIKGSTEGHTYKLKICSGHFPMNVAVNNNQLIIKNFIGEKVPRVIDIKEGVDVKLDGEIVVVVSADKEKAGNCASDLEKLTRRPGFDPRIFQDGLYIIEKDGKKV